MKKSLDKNPLVSVVVPVYNQEKHLKPCVDSILGQTYKNIEVILVNDGSTDKSGDIIREYARKYQNIKVVEKKNGGLSDARNKGIAVAKGEYISLVDSDDVIAGDFIERLLEPLIQTGNLVACCRYTRQPNDFSLISGNTKWETIPAKECLIKILYQYDQSLYTVAATLKLYNRKIFDRVKFPAGKINEDLAVIDEVLEQCETVCLIDETLYYYRVTENSIMTKTFKPERLDAIEHCDHLLQKYKGRKDIYSAVVSMKFARCLEILFTMQKSRYENEEATSKLWSYIKSERLNVARDRNVRKSERGAALMTILGRRFTYFAMTIKRRVVGAV